jgi:6-phosphogluconolactonase (cycloisomerase 2 family)
MKNRLLTLAVLLFSSFISVAGAWASGSEFVYVESNIQSANGNSIFAFHRNADGSLTQISGSPFLTAGAGIQDRSFTFGPYDSDQNIAIDSQRRLLFAVNSGSDTIAAFHINSDGSLNPVAGSPFPSNGTNPVSLALTGNTLFVANKNGDIPRETSLQPNYTAFHVEADGSLSPVAGSTVDVAYNSSPSQALVVPGTHLLFGNNFTGGLIQSFKFDDEGRLSQRSSIALPPIPGIPLVNVYGNILRLGDFGLGLITHPKQPVLYVGFVVTNQVGVYSFTEEGEFKFLRAVPNSGLAICWLRINRKGTRMYTGNNGVEGDPVHDPFSTVSVYDTTDPENPKELQTLQIAGVGNVTQIELSSDERSLYVVSQRATPAIPEGQGNALHIFNIAPDGTLTEKQSPIQLNVPVGSQPQGVAVFSER